MTQAKILVWDVPVRVFHWLLALSFAGAFMTAESERWRDIHVLLGYSMLGLILFRVLWGFVGSRYARFKSFLYGPARVAAYLKSLITGRPQHFLGHNPAGSWAIYALLTVGSLVGLSGWLKYQEIGGDGMARAHELLSDGMLGLVMVHVSGVLISSLLHRENLLRSMITGTKSAPCVVKESVDSRKVTKASSENPAG